jgi:flagellar basal-body rod protein FlgB
LPLTRIIGSHWQNFRAISRAPHFSGKTADDLSMLNKLTQTLDFNAQALLLRAERSRVLASNIANADTPNYKARDFDFQAALSRATGVQVGGAAAGSAALAPSRTAAGHMNAAGNAAGGPTMLYRTPLQTALDANTVDMDMERAAFADNTVRYEAGLRFINGQIRTLMTAINGQS